MKPIFEYFSTDGRLNVTINVFVLHIPPELFGTVILNQSDRPPLVLMALKVASPSLPLPPKFKKFYAEIINFLCKIVTWLKMHHQ